MMKKTTIFCTVLFVVLLTACGGSKPAAPLTPGVEKEQVSVSVTYKVSYAQMIDNAKFDSNQLFASMLKESPASGCDDDIVDVTLIKFNKELSFDEAVKELEKENLRPASFALTLALAKDHPQKQLLKDLVCLSKIQVYKQACLVPFLGKRDHYDKQQRVLWTKNCEKKFSPAAWFVAVPKDYKRDCNWD